MISLFTPSGKYIKLVNFCLMTCHKVVFTSEDYFNFLTIKSSKPNSGIFAGFKAFLPPSTFEIIPSGVNPRKYMYIANR